MKKTILFISTALLIMPNIALAQFQGQSHQRPPSGGRPAAPPTRPSPPSASRPSQPSRPGVGQPSRPGGPSVQPSRPGGNVRPPSRPDRPSAQPPRPGHPSIRPPRPGGPFPSRPGTHPSHRPGAGRPPNFRPVHSPAYRYPHGYRYRRWTIGLLLPTIFLSTGYYYDDYWRLGLGAPPYGCRWVRYGPDLLLVEVRSRRVVDVIYGAFY